MKRVVRDSLQVSSTACVMIISIYTISHCHVSFIHVKMFCLCIPLSSWFFFFMSSHHPAQELAPCRYCINIVNLNVSERKTGQDNTVRELGFHSSGNWAGQPWCTRMVPICSSINGNVPMWPTIIAQILTYSQVFFPTSLASPPRCCRILQFGLWNKNKNENCLYASWRPILLSSMGNAVPFPSSLHPINVLMGTNRHQLKVTGSARVQFN